MSIRITSHVGGTLAVFAALCAFPAVGQDGPTAAGQPLSQALTALATADGFEVRGLDRVGDETVQPPKSTSPVKALRRMLDGYAYTLELAPADATGKSSGKLIRVSVLGHSGDGAGNPAPAESSPTLSGAAPSLADASVQSAPANGDSQAAPAHPVAHMLQTLARNSMPLPVNAGPGNAPGQPGAVSPLTSGAGASATGASAPTAGDATPNATDMAAMTRTASGNLSALVQSLKASCPAGAKC
jgi:hypothetical protein